MADLQTTSFNLPGAIIHEFATDQVNVDWRYRRDPNPNPVPLPVAFPEPAPATTATTATPTTYEYVLIKDLASGLCWDANTVAIGALITLQPCNGISPTQNFQLATTGAVDVLRVRVTATISYCVDSAGGYLHLAACANSVNQNFTQFRTGIPHLAANVNYCFKVVGTSNLYVIPATTNCISPRKIGLYRGAAPKYVSIPSPIVNISLASFPTKCYDATNPNQVMARPCLGTPQQQWYFSFGQIRNVWTGLCLDAHSADGSNDNPGQVPITLSRCGLYPPSSTQIWIKSSDNRLINAESANCIRPVPQADGTFILKLGTDYCNQHGRDVLAQFSAKVLGINSFIVNLGDINAPCKTMRNRNDFRDLTAAQQTEFFTAMNNMRKVPSLLGRASRYYDYVSLHGGGAAWFHSYPSFLPWHRVFIAALERDLQILSGNPNLGHPYWDWDFNSDNWNSVDAGMLITSLFGTTGLSSPNYCVTDGFMAGTWTPSDAPGVPCLERCYDPNTVNNAESLYPENYALALAVADPATGGGPYQNFDNFRIYLEGLLHNSFHGAVAGSCPAYPHMADPAVSVNDPVFWQHHTNIDRIYQYFQDYNPSLARAYDGVVRYPPASPTNTFKVSPSDVLVGFNQPTSYGTGLRSGPYCFYYVPYSGAHATMPDGTFNSFNRRDNNTTTDNGDGDLVLNASVEPGIAAIMQKNQAAIQQGNDNQAQAPIMKSSTPSSKSKGKKSGKPRHKKHKRKNPSPISELIIKNMNMQMNITEIRAMEQNALDMIANLHQEEDAAMLKFFGKASYFDGTADEQAFVMHYAVAKIAYDKSH
ncbi:hypothetical protein HDU76_009095 [Blyttiomyces sp. JEL0837]|nr:hypothetical protein HDU76_009095 [Blyttiomyces sp. JEL0837]